MRLLQLEPQFIRCTSQGWQEVDAIGDADGIKFMCPKCFHESQTKIGVHLVVCWAPSVSLDIPPGPGRWKLEGTCYDDLSLVGATSSSILLSSGCRWHGFVTNGEVTL